MDSVVFGSSLKELFLLEDGYVNYNHGSFGAVPKAVMDKHIALLYEQEVCIYSYIHTHNHLYFYQSYLSI